MINKTSSSANVTTPKILLAGVFLASFSLLSLEIGLTRVLSVLFAYHYVFVVISLALLGLGLGAVFVHRYGRGLTGTAPLRYLAVASGLLSLSIPLSFALIVKIAGASSGGGILVYVPLMFAPFFFGGILMAAVFRLYPEQSSRLYSADLLGAAAGGLSVIFIMNAVGGPRTIAVISLLAFAPAVLFALKWSAFSVARLRRSAVGVLVILSLLGTALLGVGLTDVPVGNDPDKEINSLKDPALGAEIAETRWSAFGRTDLVALRNMPDEMLLYVDGTAGTPMYRFDGNFNTLGPAIQSLKTEFPAYLSLSNLRPRQKDTALVIGPGGGRDVLLGLLAGINSITAVEVNRDLVDIVRQYSPYNGGIYDRADVNLVVDEGRNFLRGQSDKYDVIMLSLPITKTSRSLDGFALTENFLFTTESINDYMEHLSDEGELVVVTHDAAEILKLLSVSLAAFNDREIDNAAAMKQIYIIGSHHFPVLVIKKTPLEPSELFSVHESIHQLGYEPTLSYLPTIRLGSCTPHENGTRFDECGMLNPVLAGLNQGEFQFVDVASALAAEGFDLSPATDDSPFFYRTEPGVPVAVSTIFWLSLITLAVLVLAPVARRRNYARRGGRPILRFVIYFALLGAGFMLVEISVFQKFILFLGQPVLSMAMLLTSLLVGAGLGSVYSGRFTGGKMRRAVALASAGIAGALIIYAIVMPLILNQLLGTALAWRLLATAVVLMPLGFMMGLPFPLGLRMMKESGAGDYTAWMWGINGVASVLGSATTFVVAMTLGFTAALLLGAACYATVCVLSVAAGEATVPSLPATETRTS